MFLWCGQIFHGVTVHYECLLVGTKDYYSVVSLTQIPVQYNVTKKDLYNQFCLYVVNIFGLQLMIILSVFSVRFVFLDTVLSFPLSAH